MDPPVVPGEQWPVERADAARNRRHLLATAREMLAEQGADKLTMDGLADRAGPGKGTVFGGFAAGPGSSRPSWTMTSGSFRSGCAAGRRRLARARRRWSV